MGDERTLSESGPSDMDGMNVTPLEPMPAQLDVPLEPFRWALRSTLAASSTDETRFVLCGVHMAQAADLYRAAGEHGLAQDAARCARALGAEVFHAGK